MSAIERVIKIAQEEIGYLEKKSNYMLYDKTANAGYNNFTKYWAEILPSFQGEPWCACFVTWCFTRAFGKADAQKLLKVYPYTYVPDIVKLFTNYSNPQVGDIVCFYRNGAFVHTGIVSYVKGDYFESIEGNTSGGSSIVANGGGVFKKTYHNSQLPGTKFIRPDYSIVKTEEDDMDKAYLEQLQKQIDSLSARLKEVEDYAGVKYGWVDDNMPEWARSTITKLIKKGIIKGEKGIIEGSESNGKLNLSYDDLRLYVTLDRAGLFN